MCLREAERVLGRGAAAEDAAQEAMVRAWRGRSECRSAEAPWPWVRRIARNEALRVASERMHLPLDDSHDVPTLERSAHELAVAAEVRRQVRGLNTQDQLLLVSRHWADLTHSEAARRLGMAEPTVRVRLHRLHRRLREDFADEP